MLTTLSRKRSQEVKDIPEYVILFIHFLSFIVNKSACPAVLYIFKLLKSFIYNH